MDRRLPHETTDTLRAEFEVFMGRLDALGYAGSAKDTYGKTVERFIRWLEGSWEPEGPR